MYTAKYGNLAMARTLVSAGANVNAVSSKGRTAVDYAEKYKQKELYKFFKSL